MTLWPLTDEQFKAALADDTGIEPAWEPRSFTDLDEDVRDNVERIQVDPHIPHTDSVRGFVFDVATGRLREVA